MSSTNTYPQGLYDAIFPWPSWIVIPDDGDPLTAKSANLFEETLNQRNFAVFRTFAKLPESASKIIANSTNGTTITIYPFISQLTLSTSYYVNNQDTTETISAANLFPAGSFSANTWYYVYQNVSLVLGVPLFSTIISTTAPHVYLLYKDNAGAQDKTNKFLFSFRTDGAAAIYPFYKCGGYTQYLTKRSVLMNGPAAGYTALSLSAFIPPHSKRVYLMLDVTNNDITTNRLEIVGGGGVPQQFYIPATGLTHQVLTYTTPTVFNLSEIDYLLDATLSTVNIDLIGYHE